MPTESLDASRRTVSNYWSQQRAWQVGGGMHWLELEAVQCRIAAKVSGDPAIDWVDYVTSRYYAHAQPVGRCLSLGCGQGWLERLLASRGFFVACDAYDIAEGLIDRARQAARDLGIGSIDYQVADINTLELPAATYDAVFAHSILHHLSNLEGVYYQIRRALKPDGLFLSNEYVGPDRFQFPRRQEEAMNAALALLPLRYRRESRPARETTGGRESSGGKLASFLKKVGHLVSRGGDKVRDGSFWVTLRRKLRRAVFTTLRSPDGVPCKLEVACPTARDVTALDPSEAMRSEDILPVMRKEFDVLEVRGYGGSLLQFLLHGIAGNFASDDPVSQPLLEMLFAIEDGLIAAGDLQHDFAVIVARARKTKDLPSHSY